MLHLIESTDGTGCIIRTENGILVHQENPDLVGKETLFHLYDFNIVNSTNDSLNNLYNFSGITESVIENFVDSYNATIKSENEFQLKRKSAMDWWNDLPENVQISYFNEYKGLNFTLADYSSQLTGREIQRIWAEKKEISSFTINPEIAKLLEEKININKVIYQKPDIRLQNIVKNLSDEQKQKLFQLLFDSIDDNKKRMFLIESEVMLWYNN